MQRIHDSALYIIMKNHLDPRCEQYNWVKVLPDTLLQYTMCNAKNAPSPLHGATQFINFHGAMLKAGGQCNQKSGM